MKYKFFGEPNTSITTKKPHFYNGEYLHIRLGKFDENGEFIADDENKYIKKLKGRFDHVPIQDVVTGPADLENEEIVSDGPADLSELNFNELKAMVKEKGLDQGKRPTKADLISLLKGE